MVVSDAFADKKRHFPDGCDEGCSPRSRRPSREHTAVAEQRLELRHGLQSQASSLVGRQRRLHLGRCCVDDLACFCGLVNMGCSSCSSCNEGPGLPHSRRHSKESTQASDLGSKLPAEELRDLLNAPPIRRENQTLSVRGHGLSDERDENR